MRRSKHAAAVSLAVLMVAVSCDRQATAPHDERAGALDAASADLTGTLTKIDTEVVPSPGDNMVVAVRKAGTFIVTLSREENQARVSLVSNSGLNGIGSTGTGDGPVKMARVGTDLIVTANSFSNDLSVLKQRSDGRLQEINRVSSGGIQPSDVGTAFNLTVVANRGGLSGDGEGVTVFEVDSEGKMKRIGDQYPSGRQPHIVVITTRGLVAVPNAGGKGQLVVAGNSAATPADTRLVAVGNASSNDVTLFQIDRAGTMTMLPPISRPVGGSPRALAFHGRSLFVATRAPIFGLTQDQIERYRVNVDGSLTLLSTTSAGYFLTDIEARDDRLFAVTLSSPTLPVNEVRAYAIDEDGPSALALVDVLALPGAPSFQQLGTYRDDGPFLLGVTQFQAGLLHLIEYRL
ncbi:hypothetical protein BH23GEM9_BH23GEM9_36430 [soil metagenome]